MWQSLFIVWRESVEALLVIGILYAWINHQPNASHAKKMLWLGTCIGVLFACALAIGFTIAGSWFSGAGGEWFQAGMIFIASLLILQMVLWMHHNGRNLKSQLEKEATISMTKGGLGILFLAMLAIAREGSETVIFLYGVGAQQTNLNLLSFIIGGLSGFILAIITFALLQLSSRIISWRIFFTISEIILLLLGCSLLMAAIDKVSGQLMAWEEAPEWLYTFLDPIWDTSNLFSDTTTLGSNIASFTGYRAQPTLLGVIFVVFYWITTIFFMCYKKSPKKLSHLD